MGPHGLRPRAAPHSLRVPPTRVCPLLRDLLRGPRSDPTGCFGAGNSGPRMSVQGRSRTAKDMARTIASRVAADVREHSASVPYVARAVAARATVSRLQPALLLTVAIAPWLSGKQAF